RKVAACIRHFSLADADRAQRLDLTDRFARSSELSRHIRLDFLEIDEGAYDRRIDIPGARDGDRPDAGLAAGIDEKEEINLAGLMQHRRHRLLDLGERTRPRAQAVNDPDLRGPEIACAGRITRLQADDAGRNKGGIKRDAGPRIAHLNTTQGEETAEFGFENDRHRGAVAKALGDAGCVRVRSGKINHRVADSGPEIRAVIARAPKRIN